MCIAAESVITHGGNSLRARSRRSFASAASYHITVRCNNQAFDLRRKASLYMKGIS
jgi:hypothetical protein